MFDKSHLKNQRGSSLIEALIALILVALIGKGAIYLTTRATAASTDQQLLSMAVTQMRAALTNPDICTTPPVIRLPNNIELTAEVQGCDTNSANIDGTDIPNIPSPKGLSVTSIDLLGGQVVVGGTWRN